MTTSFGSMRTRRATRLWQAGFYAVMITMSVVTVVPFLFMASTSFTKSFTMMTYPPTLIPDNPSPGQLR